MPRKPSYDPAKAREISASLSKMTRQQEKERNQVEVYAQFRNSQHVACSRDPVFYGAQLETMRSDNGQFADKLRRDCDEGLRYSNRTNQCERLPLSTPKYNTTSSETFRDEAEAKTRYQYTHGGDYSNL